MLHGAWSDGVSVAKAACAGLSEPMNAPTLGGALYIEAELHRLRGEFAMAERAYERANSFGCQPQPGMALLRLAQGRVDVATARSCADGWRSRVSPSTAREFSVPPRDPGRR